MKQLSIQEKAKAYGKAREKIALRFGSNVAEEIFSEFEVSEDERIRKALIKAIKMKAFPTSTCGGELFICGQSSDKCIAWLEKQESIDEEKVLLGARKDVALSIMNFLDNYTTGVCLSNSECEDLENAVVNSDWEKVYRYIKKKLNPNEFKASEWYVSPVDGKIHNIYYSDKVKPKFKVGDWVIDKQGIVHQIANVVENVTNYTYGYDIVGGGYFNDNTEGIRLWTIQDAKDGDVLVDEDNNIGIYRGKVDDVDWYSYIYLGCDNYVRCGGYHIIKNTKPATKEQCDQLEKAIADSDFTFDFKKKKLKIEKEYDGEDYGIDSLFHAQRILEKTLGEVDGYQTDDGILSHKCAISAVKKLYEKKSAWSEDDEKRVESLHGWLDTLVNYIHHDVTVSLDLRRERMQQVEQLKTWLKSIKERVQPKQEWSEEDETVLNNLIYALANDRIGNDRDEYVDWLKSIKERYTWKPSDEQFKVLNEVLNFAASHESPHWNDYIFGTLNNLVRQLKKLREE